MTDDYLAAYTRILEARESSSQSEPRVLRHPSKILPAWASARVLDDDDVDVAVAPQHLNADVVPGDAAAAGRPSPRPRAGPGCGLVEKRRQRRRWRRDLVRAGGDPQPEHDWSSRKTAAADQAWGAQATG